MTKQALIYVEIDIRVCSLTYGVLPCEAQLGVTGDEKCFNTRNQRADCQDTENFSSATKTLRFGLRDCGFLPADINCYPLLDSAKVKNAILKPGESIGERATLTANFFNGRESDAGLDPYVTERGYIAFEQGTFWGKFRARNTYLEGQAIRIIRGEVGQDLADMDVEHFIIDKMDGPNASGKVTIRASDFMKQLNSEKALAPTPNEGSLDADYAIGATSVTLLPVGIGDAEYPASGRVAIGKEVLDFTRVSDVLTFGSPATIDHKVGETAQVTLLYDAVNAAVITDDLIVNYTPLDGSYTDLPAWQDIVDDFLPQLYTREIVKPTPTRTLLNELINQAGLVVYGNTRTQQVSFDVLRPNPETGQTIDKDVILKDSFSQKDQPSKRFSNIVVYYDKRDVFASDDPQNFLSSALYIVPDDQYPTPNTLRIYSKWIQFGGLSIAADVAARAAARYRFPPLSLSFELPSRVRRAVAQVINITHPAIESATGAQGSLNAIITGVSDDVDKNGFEAEEYNIDADILAGDRIIQIDYDVNNINLRDLYDSLYSSVDVSTPPIIFIINTDVVVGSSSSSLHAAESGDWPVGVEPTLRLRSGSFLVGRGGDGVFNGSGLNGGPALSVTSPINVDNEGTIGGGGGAGGGTRYIPALGVTLDASGGGGAGRIAGVGGGYISSNGGGKPNESADVDAGGNGFVFTVGSFSGDGGNLGSGGAAGSTGLPGGSPGNAIDGVSNITFDNAGTILGAQVG